MHFILETQRHTAFLAISNSSKDWNCVQCKLRGYLWTTCARHVADPHVVKMKQQTVAQVHRSCGEMSCHEVFVTRRRDQHVDALCVFVGAIATPEGVEIPIDCPTCTIQRVARLWTHPGNISELRLSIVHKDARMSQQLRLQSGVLGESSVRGSNNVHSVEDSEDLVVV